MAAPTCVSCGAPRPDRALYCAACGAPLDVEVIDLSGLALGATPGGATGGPPTPPSGRWRRVAISGGIAALAALVLAALFISGGGADEASPDPELTPTVTPLPPPTPSPTPTVEPTSRPTPTPTPTAGPLTRDTRTLLRQLGVGADHLAYAENGDIKWINLETGERGESASDGAQRGPFFGVYAADDRVLVVGERSVGTARPGEAVVELAEIDANVYPRTSSNGTWVAIEEWSQTDGSSDVTVLSAAGEPVVYELPRGTYTLGIADDGRLLIGGSNDGTYLVTNGDFGEAVELTQRAVIGTFGPYLITNGCDGLLNCGTWVEEPGGAGVQRLVLSEIFADTALVAPDGASVFLRAYDVSASLASPERSFVIDTATLEANELPAGAIESGRPVAWDSSGGVLAWPERDGVAFYSIETRAIVRVVFRGGAPQSVALVDLS